MDHAETTALPATEMDAKVAALADSSRRHSAPVDVSRVFRIAVLAGDGIGLEVMEEALRVVQAACDLASAPRLELCPHAAGADEFLRSGEALPAQTLDACRRADAILLGAMGRPEVRYADGREITPQIDLREKLDLYCGLRPVRLYHPAHSPLKRAKAGDIDLLIVRENTEGLFSSRQARRSPDAEVAEDVLRVSRFGSERLFRAAFKLARQRRGRLTLVDKANVLPSMIFFRSIFEEVAAEFPEVETEKLYVDAAALYLVQRPESFDVVVTENMFGDILSDLAAGLVGGMGLAPSADLGDRAGLFQPAHGTAPDIAGRGIANPIAMILSAAHMLEWLGDERLVEAAGRIRRAVGSALGEVGTADLGGPLTTRQMAEVVLGRL